MPAIDPDVARQREVVDAFFAAGRAGDFEALVRTLDPNVVLRSDGGARHPKAFVVLKGAKKVARTALAFARPSASVLPVLVNGAAGALIVIGGKPNSLLAFAVSGGKIVEIDGVADPERLNQLDVTALGG